MLDLDSLRQEIDRIDRELVTLFAQRMAVTGQVGEYKQQQGLPVLDNARQQAVLESKAAMVDDPALKTQVTALYETIMAISRRQQRSLVRENAKAPKFARLMERLSKARSPLPQPVAAYQGAAGAYSEAACIHFFGAQVKTLGLSQFEDVFLAIRDGKADYGVVPIENSSTGAIRQIYDLLAQYEFSIVGETTVKVEHCLVAPPGASLDTITHVYSHEQGLFQSEAYLKTRPWVRVPLMDTAGSAKYVAESGDKTKAAICSRRAAELYGLTILKEGVNYNSNNTTRFVVVSPEMELRPGADKISAIVTTPHESGSLHEILSIFAVNGLNMVKLESRPIPEKSWEYMFFLDFTGNLTAPGMDGVLHELAQTAADFRILGNYKSNLGERKHIFLTGMMGCGKSSCARILGEKLGLPVVDTDGELQKRTGMTVSEMFRAMGEGGFRDLETALCREFSARSPSVIAVGGGLPLREENRRYLRESGRVFFLNRDPGEIYASLDKGDRPLAQKGRGEFLAMAAAREPLYRRGADGVIEDFTTIEHTVEAILKKLEEFI